LKKSYTVNNEVVFHEPDYDLMDEATDRSSDGFIKVNDKNKTPIPDDKIWYFDFETSIIGVHNQTGKPEDKLHFEEDEQFKYATAKGMVNYQPFPFFKRELNTEYYTYTQVVNYVEMQCADGDASKTMTFHTIDDFCQVLTRPEFNGTTLIAHYGQGFDFQLLYQYMFRYDSIIQGKLMDPVMRGNKIIKGYLFNDITLIDSFNYLSTGLATFPKMFGFEELSKGYFPHHFNIPLFYDYKGPIPAKEWYGYREMKPEVQRDFIRWHEQQVSKKVEFDFQAEMRKYCHSDVDVLRRGLQKFRELFIELKDLDGKPLGSDPLHYMTIAALAYDGVYRKHYLQPDTIKYLGRPKRGNYSNISIEWMEHLMASNNIFIQHAANNEEYEVTLSKPSGESYRKKVDGYDRTTNTVYEFLGCFYHSCKYCYQQDQIHPLKSTINDKGKKVYHGHVYATTMRLLEDIKDAGYNLEVIWECQWKKQKRTLNLETRSELQNRLPLNPREAYYGGRTNATSLYKKVVGDEKIFYIDVVSMYPTVMSLPQYEYPIGQHEVRRFDDPNMPLVSLDELFGFQKCRVIPPKTLFHPVLPERCSETGKLLFPLTPILGTWTHMELQKAVSLGYVVEETFEQHHFPTENRSRTLFKDYVDTFFEMKKKAEQEKNPGMKQVAKLCLNSFYGKFGFNVEKQDTTKIIRNRKQLWRVVNSSYKRSSVDVINNAVAIATYHVNDEYTVHTKSNVYIAAFVTAYARLKLYEALEILAGEGFVF
jgi:G:T-mismatch repair DNA endonuclease (very short patch repair protein)